MVMSLWPRFFVPTCIYDDIKLMVCLVSVSSVVRCVESTFAELFLQNRGFRSGADPGSWPLSGSRVNMAAGMFLIYREIVGFIRGSYSFYCTFYCSL